MKRIYVRNVKKFLLVDDSDFEVIRTSNWFYNGDRSGSWRGRVCAYFGPNKTRKMFAIGRVLLNPPSHLYVDHINGNIFDNRRSNIRLATHQQNIFNMKNRNPNQKYKGVTRRPRCKDRVWMAQIKHNGKTKCLGFFRTDKEAAEVYNKAAIKHFGEYARLNQV